VCLTNISPLAVVIVLLECWRLQRWHCAHEHRRMEWSNGTAWSVGQCTLGQHICQLPQSSWLWARVCTGRSWLCLHRLFTRCYLCQGHYVFASVCLLCLCKGLLERLWINFCEIFESGRSVVDFVGWPISYRDAGILPFFLSVICQINNVTFQLFARCKSCDAGVCSD